MDGRSEDRSGMEQMTLKDQLHPIYVATACADIRAAINELRYITDPRNAGSVANIRDRLKMALQWIGDKAETAEMNNTGEST